jgi:IclR family transcriptional regulator, KDG regulon repressor
VHHWGCDEHQTLLAVAIVPPTFGVPVFLKPRSIEFFKISQRYFPHDIAGGGVDGAQLVPRRLLAGTVLRVQKTGVASRPASWCASSTTAAFHPMADLIFNPTARPGGPDWRLLYVSTGDGGSGEQKTGIRELLGVQRPAYSWMPRAIVEDLASGFHIMKQGEHKWPDSVAFQESSSPPLYRVQVLERALGILDVLAQQDQLAPGEIASRLTLHKSTIHRLLAVLEKRGYVDRSGTNGKYSLGMKLIELGTRASSRLDLCELAGPVLDRLMEQTGETAHIGILSQGSVVSIADSESYKTLRTPSTVGRRNPAHCSSQGKVLIAGMNPKELRAFLGVSPLRKFTRKTITSVAALQRELARVRQQGYAIDDEEFEAGLKCVGAPIRDRAGDVVAAVSIAGPASRLQPERMPELIRVVMEAAGYLSRALGHCPLVPAADQG